MKKKVSNKEKLKQIADETFEIGKKTAESFNKTGDIGSLRATVAAYRCSMQSIRDQARYKVSN
jgi:hypothetical protein